MSWGIQQIAQDAIAPLFDNSQNSTSSNLLDFFLPPSRQGSIQPGAIKRFFTGYTQSQTPPNGAIQVMGTVQNLMKGLHTVVQVVSGVGNQISVLLKNPTNKRVDLHAGHHMLRGILKNVFKIEPDIIPLVAKNQQKRTLKKQQFFGKYKKIKKSNNIFKGSKQIQII